MIFLNLKTAVFAAASELIRTQSPPVLTTPLVYSTVNLLEARTGHSIIMQFGDWEVEEFLMRCKDVFQMQRNLDRSFSYRIRPEYASSIPQLMYALDPTLNHPIDFLREIGLFEGVNINTKKENNYAD